MSEGAKKVEKKNYEQCGLPRMYLRVMNVRITLHRGNLLVQKSDDTFVLQVQRFHVFPKISVSAATIHTQKEAMTF